jgi:hypothetical protein
MPVQPQNVPAALASSSDVAWLCLLQLWTKPDGSDKLYVVNNSEPVVSRGVTFEPFPFSVLLPADDSDSLPQVTLTLSNVDQRLTEYVRGLPVAPYVVVELVTSSYPDVIEKSLSFLKLVSVTYDAMTITGKLDVDNFLAQKFPAESYTPPQFPALFR